MYFLVYFIFCVNILEKKGQNMAQIDIKFCVLHPVSQEAYII